MSRHRDALILLICTVILAAFTVAVFYGVSLAVVAIMNSFVNS